LKNCFVFIKRELRESLDRKEESTNTMFFDLYPYPFQKEILEDLAIEREEFDSLEIL